MKKRVSVVFVTLIIVVMILSLSVVSAGFFDFFKKKNDVQLSATDGIFLKLDFEDGNANDKSGLNIPVSVSGATFVADSSKGKVVNFDGIDDFLKVNSLTGLAERSFTFAFFMKSDLAYNDAAVIGKQPAWIFYDASSSNLDVYFYQHSSARTAFTMITPTKGVAASSEVRFQGGQWKHIAGVFDSSKNELKLYIDGTLAETKTGIGNIGATGAIYIGKSPFGNNFKGSMDDVIVYNKALSQAEISALAGVTTSGACNNVNGYLTYSANNNNVMRVTDTVTAGNPSYLEEQILCYNGKWYEVAPSNSDWSWLIEPANVVSTCTQVGAWYADSNGLWTSNMPSECQQAGGQCSSGEILSCPEGYNLIDSSTDSTKVNHYERDDCTRKEYNINVPYRSDGRKVCRSNEKGTVVLRARTIGGGECTDSRDVTITGYYTFVEASCVDVPSICPTGQVMGCARGYEQVVSKNNRKEGGSFYSETGCVGEEFTTAFVVPHRVDERVVCVAVEAEPMNYQSNAREGSCDSFAGVLTVQEAYPVREMSCVEQQYTISEGETITVVFESINYEISIDFISSTKVRFNVNDIVTGSISGGQRGKLPDGNYIEVIDIDKLEVAGSIGKVTFQLIKGEPVPTPTCTDSDDGLSYFEKGNVSITYQGGSAGAQSAPSVDSCSGNVLTEYSCNENQGRDETEFTCPHGCQDGACITPPDRGGRAVCLHEGTSVDPRVRVELSKPVGLNYCDPRDLEFKPVKEIDTSCLNDFECRSNACIDGQCVSLKLELERQTNLLNKIWCWIKDVFGGEDYDICLTKQPGGGKVPTIASTLSCDDVDFSCGNGISSEDSQVLSTAYGALPAGKVITETHVTNLRSQCADLGDYAEKLKERYGNFPQDELNGATNRVTACTPQNN